jgi:DNA-binding IclR family transcriptional regulator
MRRRLQMSVRTRLPRERFQDLLETLSPGDEIQVTAVSKTTGLDAATCESVLEALVRVDLFTRTRERVFVRRRMLEALDRLHA